MPEILDISLAIGLDMLVWPNHVRPRLRPTARLANGDQSNRSEIQFGSHTGTHIDPPYHSLEGGATAEQLPLDVLIGPATVLDLRHVSGAIQPADLEAAGAGAARERVLFRTRNSELWASPLERFPEDYVALSPDAATWLVEHRVRLVGTDFLSIEQFGLEGQPAHRTLLRADVVIVEGLDLSRVNPGDYTLLCLPLKLVGADGTPARAVLLDG